MFLCSWSFYDIVWRYEKKMIIYEYKEIKLVLYNGNKVDGSGLYGKLISWFLVLLVYYYFNFILE